jgi:hypothetical protein
MPGYLQHGWNIGDGLAPGTSFVRDSTIFVWSEQTRRRAEAVGRRNVVVVGSPFLYLRLIEPTLGEVETREGTIWYPFHGWEQQHVQGDHGRQIQRIREVEDGPVTICLYWQEYKDPAVRDLYTDAGFRVICHGYRGHMYRDTDADFLVNQLVELRRHRRVASNRVSSALMYGIAAGCEAAVYGDPMVLQAEDPTFGGVARIRRQWPQLHGETTDTAEARAIAEQELGADSMMSPHELRAVFGWPTPTSATPAAAAVPAGGAR